MSSRIKQESRWSYIWGERISTWHAHVMRDTSGTCLSSRLLDVRSSPELAVRRRENFNRPNVRRFSGFSATRWYDSVSVAHEYITA